MDKFQVDKHPVGLTSKKTEPQVEQKAELTEPIVDTILRGQNVMWPDSKVETESK